MYLTADGVRGDHPESFPGDTLDTSRTLQLSGRMEKALVEFLGPLQALPLLR